MLEGENGSMFDRSRPHTAATASSHWPASPGLSQIEQASGILGMSTSMILSSPGSRRRKRGGGSPLKQRPSTSAGVQDSEEKTQGRTCSRLQQGTSMTQSAPYLRPGSLRPSSHSEEVSPVGVGQDRPPRVKGNARQMLQSLEEEMHRAAQRRRAQMLDIHPAEHALRQVMDKSKNRQLRCNFSSSTVSPLIQRYLDLPENAKPHSVRDRLHDGCVRVSRRGQHSLPESTAPLTHTHIS